MEWHSLLFDGDIAPKRFRRYFCLKRAINPIGPTISRHCIMHKFIADTLTYTEALLAYSIKQRSQLFSYY